MAELCHIYHWEGNSLKCTELGKILDCVDTIVEKPTKHKLELLK